MAMSCKSISNLSDPVPTMMAKPRSPRTDVSRRKSNVFVGKALSATHLQQRLAALAEARRLDGGYIDHAPQLVDNQARQRIALRKQSMLALSVKNLRHI